MIEFLTNSLYFLASKIREEDKTESEILEIDRTILFNKQLQKMVLEGKIILININGKMRLGKSTVGIAIAKTIHQALIKGEQTNKKFGIRNILRDQYEQGRIMDDPDTHHSIFVVDEWDDMEDSGENVSVLNKKRMTQGKLQAGRYNHFIYCSPRDKPDSNADIQLDVWAWAKNKPITRCKLKYVTYEDGIPLATTIGYVDINVEPIIKNWIKIKQLFELREKTTRQTKQIREMAKHDWYIDYQIRKYIKFDLMTKHKINKPRLLDYGQPLLEIREKINQVAKIGTIKSPDLIYIIGKRIYKKYGLEQSVLGVELANRELKAMHDTFKAYYTLIEQKKKETIKLHKGTNLIIKQQIAETIEQYREQIDFLKDELKEQKKYYELLYQIHEKYHEKLSEISI